MNIRHLKDLLTLQDRALGRQTQLRTAGEDRREKEARGKEKTKAEKIFLEET